MALQDDLADAFRALYTGGDDSPFRPAITEGDVHLYDVQGAGYGAPDPVDWDGHGVRRPDREQVWDTYQGLLDGYGLGPAERDRYEQLFPESADEVFRDRIYQPPHNLHAVLDADLPRDAVPEVLDGLADYAADSPATVTVDGMPVETAADGALPWMHHEPVYGDLARRVDGAAAPGEVLRLAVRIAHPDDGGEDAVGTHDDHLYLAVMEHDGRDAPYPVLFFNGLVTADKRDAAGRVAGLVDAVDG